MEPKERIIFAADVRFLQELQDFLAVNSFKTRKE